MILDGLIRKLTYHSAAPLALQRCTDRKKKDKTAKLQNYMNGESNTDPLLNSCWKARILTIGPFML